MRSVPQQPTKKLRVVFALAVVLLFTASLLIACGEDTSYPGDPTISPILASHHAHRVVYACGSVRSSYPPDLLQKFLKKLMASLGSAVQVNQDGLSLIYNEVNTNSYHPD